MKRILRNFELLFGLKVNFSKSCLMGLNIERSNLISMANILGCEVVSFPFTYLGVRVGGFHKRSSEWLFLMQKMRKKLMS